jgi:hypothetical protein
LNDGEQAPLEFLISVMRNEKLLSIRVDAAKAACPYLHPKLNMVEARVEITDDFSARLTRARTRNSAVRSGVAACAH